MHTEGVLQLVGTPIGNLGDTSARCIETLTHAAVVLAEDTRVASKLLAHFGIAATLLRCDEYKIQQRSNEVCERLRQGERVAFVSDAGMPCISDPGQRLVDAVLDAGLKVEVIPGPSAVTCAVAVSGLRCEHFLFYGFLPRKEKRLVEELEALLELPFALVFYESPHRVARTLSVLADRAPHRRAALVRELTKLHEEVLCDELLALSEQIQQRERILGECVIVVEQAQPGKTLVRALGRAQALSQVPGRVHAAGQAFGSAHAAGQTDDAQLALADAIRHELAAGGAPSAIARNLARSYGLAKRDVYNQVVAISQEIHSGNDNEDNRRNA